MTRFVIDANVALRRVDGSAEVEQSHHLVAPTALRSQVLALLYELRRTGQISEQTARRQLDLLAGLKVRLLGDRVSRFTAWRLALQLELSDIGLAEYLAVTRLQADALIAEDPALLQLAQGVVPLAAFEALQGP